MGGSDFDTLLRDRAWLGRIATRLVRDPHQAEDAVQDTLTAAHERPMGAPPVGRGWLARTLRNFINMNARARIRREAREARVARPEQSDPAADVAERLELERKLFEAVTALEEPYRTVIVLRFFEGLPPREIARRLAVPTKTVHTRIDRAVARLRGRLDSAFEDRRAWLAAFVPFADRASPLGGVPDALATAGGAAKVVAAAALVVPLAWMATRSSIERESPPVPSLAAPTSNERDETRGAAASDAAGARERSDAEPASARAPVAAAVTTVEASRGNTETAASAWLSARVVAAGALKPPVPFDVRVLVLDGALTAREHAAARTNVEGVLAGFVPAGVRLRLLVDPSRSTAEPVRAGALDVEPLEPGERREVEVVLQRGPDRTYWGQVLADESGQPIAGARAALRWMYPSGARGQEGVPVETDASGTFSMSYPPWLSSVVEVRADGFGPAVAILLEGHESSASAFPIRLARAASLTLAVDGIAAKARALARVRAAFQDLAQPRGLDVSGDDVTWEAKCDPAGSAALTGLPAGVPLEVSIRVNSREVRSPSEAIVLAPGEHRAIDITLGGRVSGTVRLETGAPIAGRAIWAVAVESGDGVGGRRYFTHSDLWQVTARVTTGASGEFEITGLGRGAWWIGLAPYVMRDGAMSIAERVEIEAPALTTNVDLVVSVPLFLSGCVVGHDATLPEFVGVVAIAASSTALSMGSVEVDATGNFFLGPLAPGTYRVVPCTKGGLRSSAAVQAEAGASGLVLRLDGSRATVSGSVVDSRDGGTCEAQVQLYHSTDRWPAQSTRSDAVGTFTFDDVPAGRYRMTATAAGGRIAVHTGLEVGEESVSDVRLALERAARLHAGGATGREGLQVRVYRAGEFVVGEAVDSDGEQWLMVPAGLLDVQLHAVGPGPAELVAERTLQAVAGETVEVDFAASPR